MAIIPRSLYPLKFKPVIPAWPQGEPQRISVGGDGTGSPWEVEIVKDIMGLQQALLLKAGVTPTGTPETALVSQYYDCLTTLFSRDAATTADLIAGSFPNGVGVQTSGFATAGDGGGAFWVATGGTGTPSVTIYAGGLITDADGRIFTIVPGPINPRQYGAVGDGVADDVIPIQDALDTQASRLGGPVYLSAGTYLCSAQLTIPDRVEFYGDGSGATTLSFAGAGGSFPNSTCLWSAGSVADLPDLSADVAPDEVSLTFVSDHSLAVDDLFLIIDPRIRTYAASNNNFRAGEFFVAADIPTSTTVDVDSPAYATTNPDETSGVDTYESAFVNMRKVTPNRLIVRDMTIVGVGANDSTVVIGVDYARSCVFERLIVSGSNLSLLQLNHSYDISITDVEMSNSNTAGTDNNGIQLSHCQRIFVTRCRGGGSNSMLSAEALSSTDSIVNRQVYIADCYAPQRGDGVGAIRFAGNSEYITISDTQVAGIQIGGDHCRISNCEIEGQPAQTTTAPGVGWAVYFLNMTGFDVLIDGCKIVARVNVDSSTALVYWKDDFFNLFRPDVVIINDTKIDMRGYSGKPIAFTTRSPTTTPSLRMEDVDVVGGDAAADICLFDISNNAGWERLEFNGCRFLETGVSARGAELISFRDTVIERSPTYGILVPNPVSGPFSIHTVLFHDCHITNSDLAGIGIFDTDAVVECYHTVSLGNNVNSSKSSDRSSFAFQPASGAGATSLLLAHNVFGDNKSVKTQTFSYHYVDVDVVTDSNTTILGGLTVTRTPTIADTLANVQDQNTDDTRNSGTLGLVRGNTATAPSGAQDLVIGTGSGNRGVYLKSSSTGLSAWMAGDTSDPDRFIIEMDHANNDFTFIVAGVASCTIDGGGINPVSGGTNSVGDSIKRWAGVYAGAHHFKRMFADGGSVVSVGSHLTKTAGWGTGSTFDSLTAGRDSLVRVVINTLGGDQSGTPSFTYTFPNGAEGSEIPVVHVTNRASLFAQWSVTSTTSTTVTVQIQGTPANSVQYGCNLTIAWIDD